MRKSKAVFTAIGILVYALFGSSNAVMAADCNHATYNFLTGVVHIPRVDVPTDPFAGLVNTYTVDLKLREGGDFVFELAGIAPASEVDECGGSGSVYTEITSSELEGILDEMNLRYESKTASDGDPLLVITLGDYTAVMFFYGCSSNGKCTSLEFWSYFSMSNPPTLSEINDWNSKWRYATAFIDSDNDPGISTDLDIAGGVSSDTIKRFIERFEFLLEKFTEHIGFRSRGNDSLTDEEVIDKKSYFFEK